MQHYKERDEEKYIQHNRWPPYLRKLKNWRIQKTWLLPLKISF